ncbi:MAG: hypothetical protein WBG18_18115 [Xanthobacteraceae bacterium]
MLQKKCGFCFCLFFRFAATLIAAIETAAVNSVSAQSVAPTLACAAAPGFARFDTPLKRVAGRVLPR